MKLPDSAYQLNIRGHGVSGAKRLPVGFFGAYGELLRTPGDPGT